MAGPFPLEKLEFTLEERREFIKDHKEEMNYICSSLNHYYEDLTHAIDIGLSHSVASHMTYTLVLTLAKGLTSLTVYDYLCGAYLLDEQYDDNYSIWASVNNSADKIIHLLAKLEERDYFEEDIDLEQFLTEIIPPHCEKIKHSKNLFNLLRRVSLISGHNLIYSLVCHLRFMEQWLSDLKRGFYKSIEEEYDRVYEANYSLYKEVYWPNEGGNFRSHIERNMPRHERLTPEYLARLQWEEKRDFTNTPTGVLWRDYYDNKKVLYIEAKRIKLVDEQWKYFFKSICRFEEYDRWIKELEMPPVPSKGLKVCVVLPEKADIVVGRIVEIANTNNRPYNILMPIRAAIDAGAINRPTWENFKAEFGTNKIKSKSSLSYYTNPENKPYSSEAYYSLVEEFRRLVGS